MVYVSRVLRSVENDMVSIGIVGASGRMGREIVAAAQGWDGVEIRGGLVRPGSRSIERDSAVPLFTEAESLAKAVDVLIDVSSPTATPWIAGAARQAGTPLVCGVTGLGEVGHAALDAAARQVPVLYARNLSPGIAALIDLLPRLLAALPEADVEIVETHHRGKKDAPSGTAQALAEVIIRARSELAAQRVVYGREGDAAPGTWRDWYPFIARGRQQRRAHDPAGHRWRGDTDQSPRLEPAYLRRRRLRAAEWLVLQPPGMYSMADVLAG